MPQFLIQPTQSSVCIKTVFAVVEGFTVTDNRHLTVVMY